MQNVRRRRFFVISERYKGILPYKMCAAGENFRDFRALQNGFPSEIVRRRRKFWKLKSAPPSVWEILGGAEIRTPKPENLGLPKSAPPFNWPILGP